MIASERSLTAAHPSPKQQQTATLGNPRNGGAKPTRPVKIYVIDPRKLQQRLEAYVDQKNQKRAEAEANEKGKAEGDQDASPTETSVPPSPPSVKSASLKSKTGNGTIKRSLANALPAIAPKSVPPSASTSSQAENPPMTISGVSLQSLPCIDGTGLGLPALPVVVTNGVALIQPQISQSSIPGGSLFLPGISAVPSVLGSGGVDGSMLGPSVVPPSKSKSAVKGKAKKKKAMKKRKQLEKPTNDEEDDGELSYLLKETTTRLGRVSRPVSQPHSPSLTAASSRATSPAGKIRRKIPKLENTDGLRCDSCLGVFINDDKLQTHLNEVPEHRSHKHLNNEMSTLAAKQNHMSTKAPNTVAQTPGQAPVFTSLGEAVKVKEKTPKKLKNTKTTSKSLKRKDNGWIRNLDEFGTEAAKKDAGRKYDSIQGESEASRTDCILSASSNMLHNDKDSSLASLVPSAETKPVLVRHGLSCSSNVVPVPSSYSIPSSPPSGCHSPGLPDDIFTRGNSISRETKRSSGEECNSPVDPMLLRSRSPFPVQLPNNNPETSSHSVGASNLSIPEESLCKGELFMDLGEAPNMAGLATPPFCEKGTTMRQLFSDTDRKDSAGEERASSGSEDTPEKLSASKVKTPMLIETTTEDANDGEIFQTANYTRAFLHPSVLSSSSATQPPASGSGMHNSDERSHASASRTYNNGGPEFPRTPQSAYVESDISMDSSAEVVEANITNRAKCRSVWHFVKDQIKSHGISQACGEISEMADKLSRIARDHFIPIREDEVERLGTSSSIITVDTPFFSHLLDLPFGMYIFKEDIGKKKKGAPPPPMTSSELSFTGGVEDVEKFLPPDIDLISLPHLTNLDLT